MARQLVYVSDPVWPCVRMTRIKTDLQCQHKLVSSCLNSENNRTFAGKNFASLNRILLAFYGLIFLGLTAAYAALTQLLKSFADSSRLKSFRPAGRVSSPSSCIKLFLSLNAP
jgi:hypothetical protein